ncbi:MAG: NUDIX domain-containing protein [Anaerolineae bacterium]
MPISEWVKQIRAHIGTDLVVFVGAAAIVTDADRQNILLQQRTDNGLWGVPGGSIEPGEEPAQAAIREVFEETGLHVEVMRLVGVFGGDGQIRAYANGDRFAYVSVTFECRVIGGEINPDPVESQDVRWFSIDNLPPEFTDVHQRRLTAWQSRQFPMFLVPEFDPQTFPQTSYMQSLRQRIGNLLVMSPGSTAVIFDQRGRVLVQKRKDDGLWDLPGGLYEPGEEPAGTVMREVYEETGLIVHPTRLIGVYGGETYCHTYPNGHQVSYINFVFQCTVQGGQLSTDNDETLALRFVDPHQLPQPFTEKHRQIIHHSLTLNSPYFTT